jgi:hypothetical protein
MYQRVLASAARSSRVRPDLVRLSPRRVFLIHESPAEMRGCRFAAVPVRSGSEGVRPALSDDTAVSETPGVRLYFWYEDRRVDPR